MKKINLILSSFITAVILISCNSEIDKEFITLNSVQIGDNISQYKKYKLDDEQDSFFDIYTNKEKITINELEGNLKLFVSDSIIQKIQFNSAETFRGSTSPSETVLNEIFEERNEWVRVAMQNYNISEWNEKERFFEYVKQDYLHQYNMESINHLGKQLGWNMSYEITSKDAQLKEKKEKENNLDFGSTKTKGKKNIKGRSTKKILITLVSNLSVRVSPDPNSNEVENLPVTTEVQYLNEKSDKKSIVKIYNTDINDNWYKIKTKNGNIGWIHGCCIESK